MKEFQFMKMFQQNFKIAFTFVNYNNREYLSKKRSDSLPCAISDLLIQ